MTCMTDDFLLNRRTHEDMHLFSIILNQEIRRLSTQVSVFPMLAEVYMFCGVETIRTMSVE